VTATIDRTDRALLVGEGCMFESLAYEYPLWAECGPSAVRDGWLVPPVQGFVTSARGSTCPPANSSRDGDFTDDDLARVFSEEEMLHRVAVPLREKAGDRKTVVFCATVAHAAGCEKGGRHIPGLADVLDRYAPGKVRCVHGRMSPGDQRRQEMAWFKRGQDAVPGQLRPAH
jgi:hypothetical protein